MYEAWEAETKEEAKSLKEATDYRKGMEAGRRALGEEIFKNNNGHFWGYTPSRPQFQR
jgi:hypothetical protein